MAVEGDSSTSGEPILRDLYIYLYMHTHKFIAYIYTHILYIHIYVYIYIYIYSFVAVEDDLSSSGEPILRDFGCSSVDEYDDYNPR
jgi:hypothetical protein